MARLPTLHSEPQNREATLTIWAGFARSTDYLKRAVVAAFGWPANRQEDAVYPYTELDGAGQKLSGANKYTLTFAKGQTPPVDGFWSITMYEIDKGWWFVPNVNRTGFPGGRFV